MHGTSLLLVPAGAGLCRIAACFLLLFVIHHNADRTARLECQRSRTMISEHNSDYVVRGNGAIPFIEIPSANGIQAAHTVDSTGDATDTGISTRGP